MKISDILDRKSVAVSLAAENKVALLNKMIELAAASGKVMNTEEAKREVFAREKIMSTGIGKGIALPHAKSNSVSDTIAALAILAKPLDYEALDGEPISIAFLLIGRENNVGNHLRLLSKISRLMNNDTFRTNLLQSKSQDDVIDLFRKIEENE